MLLIIGDTRCVMNAACIHVTVTILHAKNVTNMCVNWIHV